MKRIGVFTSGGDAPGMNACIRSVVRSALHSGIEVMGIQRGYSGMIDGDFIQMHAHSVSNIIQYGGTILKTARSEEFLTKEGREKAADQIRAHGVDGLVAIGGDGTFRGAVALEEEFGIPIVGAPGTIDNDLYGTDYTIGFDTAVNTALESIDKIRDTAYSFDRTFYVEVMGRHSGFIATEVALASGAEYVIIPEVETDFHELSRRLLAARPTKRSNIVIVAEGDETGGAITIAKKMNELHNIEYRICILGHVQRGGSPSAHDRILAGMLGRDAVKLLMEGKSGVMIGRVDHTNVTTPLRETYEKKKQVDLELVRLLGILAK